MPGFNIDGKCPSGSPGANNEYRRVHRWTFEVLGGGAIKNNIILFLQSAARPSGSSGEAEVHHDQEVAYFAGKSTWDPIELTWYDSENADCSGEIWQWYNSVVDFGACAAVNAPSQYKQRSKLMMYDGRRLKSEGWTLYNSWPTKLSGGDLNYTNGEIALVKATMRFDRAMRESSSRFAIKASFTTPLGTINVQAGAGSNNGVSFSR